MLFSPKVNQMIDEVANLQELRETWLAFFADNPATKKISPVSREIEVLMFRRLRHAERNKNTEVAKAERERIILANIGLLFFSQKKTGECLMEGNTREDFIQDAYTTMDKCVGCFDYKRGFKFSTYATRSIISESGRRIAKKRVFTVDISRRFGLSVKEKDDGVTSETAMIKDILDNNLVKLLDIQKAIIESRYHMGLTLLETAKRMKDIKQTPGVLTKERIRQIEVHALKRIGKYITDNNLLKKERSLVNS